MHMLRKDQNPGGRLPKKTPISGVDTTHILPYAVAMRVQHATVVTFSIGAWTCHASVRSIAGSSHRKISVITVRCRVTARCIAC